MENSELVRRALAALRSEPRLGPTFKLDLIRMEPDGAALLEGEVETVAQKRLALERVAAIPDLNGLVDRIRVRPAVPMSDNGIRDHLRKVLVREPAFEGLRITEWDGKGAREVRGATRDGEIAFEVQDGVVTLNGRSQASPRSGSRACWHGGSRVVATSSTELPSRRRNRMHRSSSKRPCVWRWRRTLWSMLRRSGSAFAAASFA
ncbi:hypothetical protein ABIE78_000485 [Sinorhizobium fredii]|nr:hypothetical protein EFR01_36040 [Sinorhizobium fredii]GLS11364.1 hypothetical protein GCM10007864_49950 [Sinorhizobium fredii]CCE99039.1 hypothetical protein SFHH103_04564 [Sinorhizobium fredii HH103]